MKLIEIIDTSRDHLELEWYQYMNDYCEKEHIMTKYVCFLSSIPILNKFTPRIVSYLIEYNYNLVLGYIIAIHKTRDKLKDILQPRNHDQDQDYMIKTIEHEVEQALIKPYRYVEYLESKYEDLLIYIETKQMILLLISKQKSHLEDLKKNGEISDRIHETLHRHFSKQELKIKRNLF